MLLLVVALVAGAFSVAAQETTEVVVDDPTGALGDNPPPVEQAAGRLLEGGVFVVSVVPSLAGQPVEQVIAERFAQLAPLSV